MRRWCAGVLALSWLAAGDAAAAGPCGEPDDLQTRAARGQLTETERACLEDHASSEASSADRTASSFALIMDAYGRADVAEQGDRMRHHLTNLHTTDAEVAFMYANHLFEHTGASDEVLQWSKVAMDGRRRWLHNRANYDRMVKILWELLVEVSMVRATEVAALAKESPTPENEARMEAYRHQARLNLLAAAPCLHYGECGPYYDVEVEGYAECDDLEALERKGARGQVTADEQACLRSKYRRKGSPKVRILTLLANVADADAKRTPDADRDPWKELLAWHYNVTGLEDPMLAARFAEFLVATDVSRTEEALRWAESALGSYAQIKGHSGREAVMRLHQLRIEAMEQVVAAARNRFEGDRSPLNKSELQAAKTRLEEARRGFVQYCANSQGGCPTAKDP